MIKKKHKYLIIWFLVVVSVVSIIYIDLFSGIELKKSLANADILIGMSSILIVIWGEQHKMFNNLLIRLLLIIFIGIYTFTVFVAYFIDVPYFGILHSLSILVILVLMSLVSLRKLFKTQVSSDVYILMKKAEFQIRKLNKEFKVDDFVSVLEMITRWSEQNLNINKNKNDIKTIVKLYSKVNNLLIKNHYFFEGESDKIDGYLSVLTTSYEQFYVLSIQSGLDNYLRNLIIEMTEHFYESESKTFLSYYLSAIYSFIEFDFSISSKAKDGFRNTMNIENFFEFVEKKYTKGNMMNDLVIDYMSKYIFQYQKYSFNLSDKVTIFVLQGYINAILHLANQDYDLLDVSNMKALIRLLYSECISRDLHLFYNTQLTRIMRSNEEKTIDIMGLVFRIVHANEYDKVILNRIVDNIGEIVSNESKYQYFGEFLVLLSKLNFSEKKYHSLNSFFLYVTELNHKERIDFLEKNLRVMLYDKDNIQYIFEELTDFVEEKNVESVIFLTKIVVDDIYYKDNDMKDVPFLRLFGKISDLSIKKYANNESKLDEVFNKNLENIKVFSRNAASIEVDKMIISLLDDYLDNKLIGRSVLNYLMSISYEAIESGDEEVYNKISNSLGWHLYNLISKRVDNSYVDEFARIKNILKNYLAFYKEVYEFHPKDSIFVGTVIVVNTAKIEALRLDSVRSEDKSYYGKIKSHFITEILNGLSKEQLVTVEKSFRIRKFSINKYVECEKRNSKEIVNDILKELNTQKYDK